MSHTYCMILTTTDNQAEADHLASMLVSQGLAACVQVSAVASTYIWEGTTHKELEWLLLIKTRAACYPQVESALRSHHSYDNPEIIQVPITQGSASYLAWIDENTLEG